MKDACKIGETNINEEKIKDLVGIPKFVYVHNIIKSIVQKDVERALKSIDEVLEDGKDLENFLWEMIKHTKDILMCKVEKKLDLYSEDEQKQMKDLADDVSKEELINIIYKLSELESKMRLSSQKIIVFETEIIKLCVKSDVLGLEDRVLKIEKMLQSGEGININKEAIQNVKNHTEIGSTVSKSKNLSSYDEPKESMRNISIPEKIAEQGKNISTTPVEKESLVPGVSISGWQNVMKNLKTQGKVMLYANLINTEAVELNDMTVAIRFNNGLTPFRKELLERSENLNILNKEIAMICGRQMQIKFEDASGTKNSSEYHTPKEVIEKPKVQKQEVQVQDESMEGFLEELDIPINFVDEE